MVILKASGVTDDRYLHYMKLYRTAKAVILHHPDGYCMLNEPWDELINRDNLHDHLSGMISASRNLNEREAALFLGMLLPPAGRQEVWAAGVTYMRSRDARMEESKGSGGASLYDRVYEAERPELFFKANAGRVAAHGQQVNIRRDSDWNVPEPELTLFLNSNGSVQGYTIGNDMSSRSIEGENALYLPQAKVYERSAALGPCLYVPREPIEHSTVIRMIIRRDDKVMYDDSVAISKIKRTFEELSEYLFRECNFDDGVFLMTGTCLVPPDGFTLQEGDVVEISIGPIGVLSNFVGYKK